MKKTILKIALFTVLGFTYACGNQSQDKKEEQQTKQIEKTDKTEDANSKGSTLVLNNGKRWEANPETTNGVNNMRELLASFTQKEDVKGYATLTEELNTQFTMIFKKCTMKGEAHNQLHNFLIPIKELLKTLASNDLRQCRDSYTKLNEHLETYKNYFN